MLIPQVSAWDDSHTIVISFWPLIILWAGFRAQTCVFTANKDDKYVKKKIHMTHSKGNRWLFASDKSDTLCNSLYPCNCLFFFFFWLKGGLSKGSCRQGDGSFVSFSSCSRSKGERERSVVSQSIDRPPGLALTWAWPTRKCVENRMQKAQKTPFPALRGVCM